MTLHSARDVVIRMQSMEREYSTPVMQKKMSAVGLSLKPLGQVAAASTKLGSDAMFTDGWSRAGPMQAAYAVHGDGLGVTMHRGGKSAGPWRVAEEGRNQGNASGFSGPGINTRTGVTSYTKAGKVRKVRERKAKRWNGVTEGFGAWSAAVVLFEAAARKKMRRPLVTTVTDSFLGK